MQKKRYTIKTAAHRFDSMFVQTRFDADPLPPQTSRVPLLFPISINASTGSRFSLSRVFCRPCDRVLNREPFYSLI